ncbi:hypothetical protein [Secundilactobacillus oryzae]|uniref:hypothetical protein n=1 Tax=Secundilactobacillus oryzae TaxID=1202668 RepID=UPI00054F6571|nr:hypothetical protein [Secundilactobacillus oryzae]
MKRLKYVVLGAMSLSGLLFFSNNTQVEARQVNSKNVMTTKSIRSGKVVIPAKTRFQVQTYGTENGKRTMTVSMDQFNYQIRRQTTKSSVKFAVNNTIKKANATYQYLYLVKGKTTLSDAAYKTAPRLIITTNGYAEYYKSSNLKQKPVSATKLNAIRKNGNITYYYAKTNMLKLPDKHIQSKTKKYNCRLAIRSNKNYGSYSVGTVKNYFYVPTGNA